MVEKNTDDMFPAEVAGDVLRERSRRYRLLFENRLDGILIGIADGRILDANAQICRILGYKRDELLGKSMSDVMDLSDSRWSGALEERDRTGSCRKELNLRCSDGTVFSAEVTAQTSRTRDGLTQVSLIARDLAGREEIRRLLRIQYEFARALASLTTLDKGLELCLKAALRITGMEGGAVFLVDRVKGALKLACHDAITAPDLSKDESCPLDSRLGKLVLGKSPRYMNRADGGDSPLEELGVECGESCAVLPLLHSDQALGCMILSSANTVDLSPYAEEALESISSQVGGAIARLEAESMLRKSEESYRILVERSHEVIFSLDIEGRFVFLNPAFQVVTGMPPEEWLGRSFGDFIHPEDLPRAKERFRRVLRGELLPENEVRGKSESGKFDQIIEYSGVPLVTGGEVTGVLGVARNITGRKRSEEDRRNLSILREREEISRWLHDNIGADLYNVTLLVDGIQRKDPGPAALEQQLEWISETSRKSLAGIRNYLDFASQVGSSFEEMMEYMERYGRSLLSPLGIGFTFVRGERLTHPSLSGFQSFSLFLIFKESLTNIVKHAGAGKVVVAMAVRDNRLIMSIEDDGDGFVSTGVVAGHYGTANIKARAEAMGARLRIDAAPTKGTCVEFSLPL